MVTRGFALWARFRPLGSLRLRSGDARTMDGKTPVLIGAGQFTYRGDPAASPSPVALLKIAAERAAADAGLGAAGLSAIDSLAVVGFTVDAPGGGRAVPHA